MAKSKKKQLTITEKKNLLAEMTPSLRTEVEALKGLRAAADKQSLTTYYSMCEKLAKIDAQPKKYGTAARQQLCDYFSRGMRSLIYDVQVANIIAKTEITAYKKITNAAGRGVTSEVLKLLVGLGEREQREEMIAAWEKSQWTLSQLADQIEEVRLANAENDDDDDDDDSGKSKKPVNDLASAAKKLLKALDKASDKISDLLEFDMDVALTEKLEASLVEIRLKGSTLASKLTQLGERLPQDLESKTIDSTAVKVSDDKDLLSEPVNAAEVSQEELFASVNDSVVIDDDDGDADSLTAQIVKGAASKRGQPPKTSTKKTSTKKAATKKSSKKPTTKKKAAEKPLSLKKKPKKKTSTGPSKRRRRSE